MDTQPLIPFEMNISTKFDVEQKANYDSFKNKDFSRISKLLYELEYYANQPNITPKGSRVDTLEKILVSFKDSHFNIKGTLVDLTQAINLDNHEQFETELKISDIEESIYGEREIIIHSIFFRKISKTAAEILNKLPKGITVYFIDLKAYFYEENNKFKLKFFYEKNKSKFFCSSSSLIDNNGYIKFSYKTTEIYELKLKEKKQILDKEMAKRIENKIKNEIKVTPELKEENQKSKEEKTKTPEQNDQPASIIPKPNTFQTIIKNKSILNKIKSLPFDEFNSFLRKGIKEAMFPMDGMNDALKEVNMNCKKYNIMGIISSIKFESKFTSMELLSITDSNKITLIHYPNSWNFFPEKFSLIYVKNAIIKLNKHMEFIIENPYQQNVEIIGKLSEEEFQNFSTFRVNKNIPFTSLISLIGPTVVRNICKIYLQVREILSVYAKNDIKGENNNPGILKSKPKMHLYAKLLVDDGSYQGELTLSDHVIAKMFHLGEEQIIQIGNLLGQDQNLIFVQKSKNLKNIIKNEVLEEIFESKYIFYCIPITKVSSKQFGADRIMKYLENLGKRYNIVHNVAVNSVFINGDFFYEVTIGSSKAYLYCKPILKGIYFEPSD